MVHGGPAAPRRRTAPVWRARRAETGDPADVASPAIAVSTFSAPLVGPGRTVSYNHTTGWTPVAASKVPAATRDLEIRAVTKQVEACCTSPGALGYWFVVSLIAWGALSLIGFYWGPLHASPAAACFGGMAIGCLANWHRNRSLHCVITGPLFLIAGVVFLLSGERMIHVNTLWVWRFVFIGVGIAFLLEWRYAKRSPS
jgi:hypothetical protein